MGLLGFRISHAVFVAIVVPIALLGLHFRPRLRGLARAAWWTLLAATGFIVAVRVVRVVVSRVSNPREWDFLSFWLGGRVAVQGLNFYDPAIYAQQALPLTPSSGFLAEIIHVGYLYPPHTMLLMGPLGWFEYPTALALWYGLAFVALALALLRTCRVDGHRPDLECFAAAGILALVFPSGFRSIGLGQSSFLLLLAVLLFWQARNRVSGGVWLAVATIVKPLALLVVPWLALRRYWRALAGFVIVLAAANGVALILFGPHIYFAYFTEHVVGRLPMEVYTQQVNQGLLAVLLRGLSNGPLPAPLMFPPYLLASGLVVAVTGLATWRAGARRELWSLGAVLLAALLVYPSSLLNYSVVYLVPMVALWNERDRLPGGAWATMALFTGIFVLNAMAPGNAEFAARAILWMIMIALALWSGTVVRRTEGVARPVPA